MEITEAAAELQRLEPNVKCVFVHCSCCAKKKEEDMLSLTRIKNLCKQIFPALQWGSPAELVAAATSAAAACVENLVTTNIQKKSSFSLKKKMFSYATSFKLFRGSK